tara:strand:- start:2365 stop:3804 length:1440 start_codon:yes stop_codon:yes gene_type:complete
MSDRKIYPVILCGGSGTRLWPLSRKSYPKQFLKLNSKSQKSLLQQTQERLEDLKDISPPILICNEDHRFIAAEQMREINIKPCSIILEPFSKNTSASITLAALNALEVNEDAILFVLASDHLMTCNKNFKKSLSNAINLAEKGRIVTFGVKPFSPNTGFGYIESQEPLDYKNFEGCNIHKFIEKPSLQKANTFLLDKKYSWNSGMFVFKASTVISEIKKFQPNVFSACFNAMEAFTRDLDFKRIDKDSFSECPSISIDVAVMENTKIGSVVPLNSMWTDIGNWKSLWEYETKNQDGNVLNGKILLKDVRDSYFNSEKNRLIVGIGLKDLIVVDTHDALLVCEKNYSQEIKNLVEQIRESGMPEAENHKKGFRPWGNYLSLANDQFWQVKLIEVKPGASLSFQMHHHRSEHWVVVKGTALVRIDNKKTILKENQSTFIPLGTKHQLSNPGRTTLHVIEVQSGTYLGEDDIVRFEDKYGRY